MNPERRPLVLCIGLAGAVLWALPFAWMAVASLRPADATDMASLWPFFRHGDGGVSLANYREAWSAGNFPLWYLNTILLCGGLFAVQLVTSSLAGYAFARLHFRGSSLLFHAFLLQLMLPPVVLLVPNLKTIASLGLYDHLAGIAAPYAASAFGVFLMRQTFRSIPRDFEDAARVDGAGIGALIRHVLLPLARPGIAAFAIVSVASHWNEFLWPLIATASPSEQVLTVGLASFTTAGEAGAQWGLIAAGTVLVVAPLVIGFALAQRHFVSALTVSGLK
ncbi:MAG: carbohydrate ABC transporter permease [Rhodospirillales bacterium]|nr:carbohydrate ABC transporter permease [Rhodospirillales bacterium]